MGGYVPGASSDRGPSQRHANVKNAVKRGPPRKSLLLVQIRPTKMLPQSINAPCPQVHEHGPMQQDPSANPCSLEDD